MEEILKKLAELDAKIEQINKSVEISKKYFKWTLILSLVFFILPLIIVIAIFPFMLSTFSYSNLGL